MSTITYRTDGETKTLDLTVRPGSLQRKDGKLKKRVKEKWVAALESGDYPQTRGNLKGARGYCCLGVLACELDGIEKMRDQGFSLLDFDLLDEDLQHMFAHRNDISKWGFKKIAKFIRENL